ncbi:hypothetical protein ACROYT_G018094 [Oculina patagonica]
MRCEDRGPKKNGVSDVRRELNLSESGGEHKWICWSSTVAMNYKCACFQEKEALFQRSQSNTILKRRPNLSLYRHRLHTRFCLY